MASSDTFGLEAYNEELKRAVRFAHEFLDASARGEPIWLSLLGNGGAGKTHLAMALYQRFRPKMVKSRDGNSASGFREKLQKKQKFNWAYITQKIRDRDYGIVSYICDDVDFAVIDDLGAGYDSEITKAKASEIAERRIGKPTIWTSNLDLERIAERIDARVASRLLRHGSKVVVFEETQDWSVLQFRKESA